MGALAVAFLLSFASSEQLGNPSDWRMWAFWSLAAVGAVGVLFDWWTHFKKKRAEKRARKDEPRLDL